MASRVPVRPVQTFFPALTSKHISSKISVSFIMAIAVPEKPAPRISAKGDLLRSVGGAAMAHDSADLAGREATMGGGGLLAGLGSRCPAGERPPGAIVKATPATEVSRPRVNSN